MLEMLTIEPETPRSIIPLATICETTRTARRLIAIVASHDSTLVSRNGSRIAMAALLTRRSMSPACCAAPPRFCDIPKVGHDRFAPDLVPQSLEIRSCSAYSDNLCVETVT